MTSAVSILGADEKDTRCTLISQTDNCHPSVWASVPTSIELSSPTTVLMVLAVYSNNEQAFGHVPSLWTKLGQQLSFQAGYLTINLDAVALGRARTIQLFPTQLIVQTVDIAVKFSI